VLTPLNIETSEFVSVNLSWFFSLYCWIGLTSMSILAIDLCDVCSSPYNLLLFWQVENNRFELKVVTKFSMAICLVTGRH
jgi:hypothetical protein